MKPWEREELEEIEYEAKSVKELVLEMKNISELILDLAYAAVIYDDDSMADEVRYLEAHMDTLRYHMRLACLLVGGDQDEAERLAGVLQVSSAAEAISNAAGDIVALLETIEARPFLPRLLERADEKIKQYKLPDDSPMSDRSLSEMHVEAETGMRVIAIRRGRGYIYGPSGATSLRASDVLILRGSDDGFEAFKDRATGRVPIDDGEVAA